MAKSRRQRDKARIKRDEKRARKKNRTPREPLTRRQIISRCVVALIMLVFCVFMISPLRGCTLTNEGYIGEKQALNVALTDGGFSEKSAEDVDTEMVKIDGTTCYKVEFSIKNDCYSYIIGAKDGDVIVSRTWTINN